MDIRLKYDEGNTLDNVIDEVLNDKDIFTFLAMHSKRGQGLRISSISYFDDINVYVHYGLTLDFDEIPRRVKLYQFESLSEIGLGKQKNFRLGTRIYPEHGELPFPEDFAAQVNRVLKNPKNYLIELDI